MSGVSLHYPFKPSELADDLESFVHVICINALQFHAHTLTAIDSNRTYRDDELRVANKANVQLSNLLFNMYYESHPRPGGFQVGGEYKITRNKLGDPGFKLIDEQCPLAVLMKELYGLLQLHYAAINFTDLERYGVARPVMAPSAQKKMLVSAITLIPVDISQSTDAGALSPTTSRPTGSPINPATVQQVEVGERPFDAHEPILKAFSAAFTAILAHQTQLKGQLEVDKSADQFIGLGTHVLQSEKAASGSKRKSAPSSGQDEFNEAVSALKAANVGASARLPSVHEDHE